MMTVRHWPISVQRSAAAVSPAADGLKSRLLEGMATPQIESILAAATPRRYPAKSVVTNQGDPADFLFLLTKGYARHFFNTQQGRKVLLLWLPPGDVFGGMALLPESSCYLVSTEIVKDSCVLVWRRNTIRDLARRYPELLENALSIASDYFAWYLATHVALISHSARERLAQVVTSLAHGIGHKVHGGVKLEITNEQLANAANLTLFTASRLLGEWQRKGAIVKGRGSILLRTPQRLFLRQV